MRPLPRPRPARSSTTSCRQCGHRPVDVIAAGRRRARCSCRSCGAAFAVSAQELEPLAEPRAQAQPGAAPAVAAAFLPADVRAYLDRRGAAVPEPPDREALASLWARADAGRGASAAPPFGRVLDVLRRRCFDEEAAVAALAAEGADERGARERVRCMAAWIASPAGAAHDWRSLRADGPSAAALAPLLAPGALDERLDHERYRLLHAALFGTSEGPALRDLTAQFGRDRVVAALEEHTRTGGRPLLGGSR
jgi:hypothetical protein